MQNAALRTAVILDDPLSSIRISAKLAPRLRERGRTVLVPSPAPGNLFRDAEECCARAASFAGEFDLIAVGWGAAVAARVLTRRQFGQAALIAPPLSKRLLNALPDSPHSGELLECAVAVRRDAWLISGDLLVLWPGNDPDYPLRDAKRLLARIPDSEISLLPGAARRNLESTHLPAVFARLFSFFACQNAENACENQINVYNK